LHAPFPRLGLLLPLPTAPAIPSIASTSSFSSAAQNPDCYRHQNFPESSRHDLYCKANNAALSLPDGLCNNLPVFPKYRPKRPVKVPLSRGMHVHHNGVKKHPVIAYQSVIKLRGDEIRYLLSRRFSGVITTLAYPTARVFNLKHVAFEMVDVAAIMCGHISEKVFVSVRYSLFTYAAISHFGCLDSFSRLGAPSNASAP
jgi:hypothetical protein